MKAQVFTFAGRVVVTTHIQSYWIEAGDVVCIQLSSGEVLKQDVVAEDAQGVISDLSNVITNNLHN